MKIHFYLDLRNKWIETDVNCPIVKTEQNDAPPGIKKLNTVFDPWKVEERKEAVREAKTQYDNEFGSMDVAKSYKSLFEILWYSQLPCFDVENITSEYIDEMSLIKRCYWKGIKINCSSIFFTRPTDRGMCCTFNMEKAEAIFKKSQYATMVSQMQEQDAKYSFEKNELPEWYTGSKEPHTQPGQDKGLHLVLDAHTNRVSSGTVSDNFRGFVTVVDGPDKYPLTSRKSFLIRPGKANYVAINSIQVEAEPGVKKVNAMKRDCYFTNEYPLDMHKNYSQSNCLLECFIQFARNKMQGENETQKCTPWFYPVEDKYVTKMCDPWETKEFQKWISSAPDKRCSHCLTDCEGSIYGTRIYAAPFRPCDHTNLGVTDLCYLESDYMNPPIWTHQVREEYLYSKGKLPSYISKIPFNIRKYVPSSNKTQSLTFKEANLANPNYDTFKEDIAIVRFYFDKSTVFQFKRYERLTLTGYISQIGGLLGLAMGFSFVSAVEIIYWIVVRCPRNVSSFNRKTSKKVQSRKEKLTIQNKRISAENTFSSLNHSDTTPRNVWTIDDIDK